VAHRRISIIALTPSPPIFANTTHLDSVMRVAIEGPTKIFEFILQEAISLWKDSRKFRFLFTNPEKYLAGRVEVESEDGEDFHP
jgi:hypothetical protein